MNKTIIEDWVFTVTVLRQKPCRMGFEVGDTFQCKYECPTGFCPKTMAALHTLCEVARAGGDYTLLGSRSKHAIEFSCADGVVDFLLEARYIG